MATEVSVRFPQKPKLSSWVSREREAAGRGGRSEELDPPPCELSVVMPVYNGSATVGRVVEEMLGEFHDRRIEVVLVDDGSRDHSPAVCAALAEKYPGKVVFIQLARNFGEHNAVLAGLREARGDYAAIVDDDGQHPAADVRRMLDHAQLHGLDAVYGRFRRRCHPYLRIFASWAANGAAGFLLRKPRGLYLSSFKVMSRFAIDQVCRYQGPVPYVDALLLRATDRIAQIEVEHRPRAHGRSSYNFRRLFALWMGIVVEYSLAPFRMAIAGGLALALLGAMALAALAGARVLAGYPMDAWIWVTTIAAFAGGLQFLAVGVIAEYVSRMMLHHSGMPQQVVRSVTRNEAAAWARDARDIHPRSLPLRSSQV
jgi:hypothetical protein